MDEVKFYTTEMKDLYIIEPKCFKDSRGYFMESYNAKNYAPYLNEKFVQDNESCSKKYVLRGLHYQNNHPQGKLVRVLLGEVYDVVVDIRKNSKTFGKNLGIFLSSTNKLQMYIPPGFAHGFLVLSDEAWFAYKCTDYYYKDEQRGIIWNDKDLDIKWPVYDYENIIVSTQDANWPAFEDYVKQNGRRK